MNKGSHFKGPGAWAPTDFFWFLGPTLAVQDSGSHFKNLEQRVLSPTLIFRGSGT